MLRSIGGVRLGTPWQVRRLLVSVGLLLTVSTASIPTARPQEDKIANTNAGLVRMRPDMQAQASAAAAASGPPGSISIKASTALFPANPSKPPFRPNSDAKPEAPGKNSNAPGDVQKSSPGSQKQEDAEEYGVNPSRSPSAEASALYQPAPSSEQPVEPSIPSPFSASPAAVSTAELTSEGTAGGEAVGADGSGGAEDVSEGQEEPDMTLVEGLEPMTFYDITFSNATATRLQRPVKHGETIQQVLRSNELTSAIKKNLTDDYELWLQLQVEARVVYLDKPIEIGAELIGTWGARTVELQMVAVPGGGGGGEPAAVNATAHKQQPLQLVCRKATSAFKFGYIDQDMIFLATFMLSGPLVISNCSETAVVIEEAPSPTPENALAEQGPANEAGSTSSGSSDPKANLREPTSTHGAVVFSHVHFRNNSGTKGGALRVGPGRVAAMRHAVFEDNSAAEGAAILLEEGALLQGVLNSHFERNSPLSPDHQGSAISLQPGACWAFCGIINSTFINNRGRRGGAVHAAGAPSSCNFLKAPEEPLLLNQANWISGSEFSGNLALENGGAVYYKQIGQAVGDGSSHVHLHNVTMKHNKALGGSGGAMWISTENGLLVSNYSTIHGNTAAAAGGGIWLNSPGSTFLQFRSTTFSNNVAGVAAVQLPQQLMTSNQDATTGTAQVPGSRGCQTSGRRLLQEAAAGPSGDKLIRLAQGNLVGASAAVAEALIGSGGAVGAGGSVTVVGTKLKVVNNNATRSGGGLYCHACLSVEINDDSEDTKVVQQGSSEWVGNSAGGSGGAIATYVLKSWSKIFAAKFQNNGAGVSTLNSGGCVSNISDQASLCPCGFGGGGAVCLHSLSEIVSVTDSKFEGNSGRFGGAAFVDTSLCTRLGMACPVNITKATFSKNAAAISGSDIYWTDINFATTQQGAACLLGLLKAATANGTYCSNNSSHTMTSSSKESPAMVKALNGLRSGQCEGNKFLGNGSASQQQFCKIISSRPSQVEVEVSYPENSANLTQAGAAAESPPAAAGGSASGGGRHLLQEQVSHSSANDEGFVVANDAPFNVAVTLKDALGNAVNETDVPVDVSLQSRATAIRQPPARFSPSGQYLLNRVGAHSTDVGRQRVDAVAVMGEQRVAKQELPLYIRRCTPGEITISRASGSSEVCKYCGPSFEQGGKAQISLNPSNGSCDPCPDGAFMCDGVLLTPLQDRWQSHPFSLQMHPCPIQGACMYTNRSQNLTDWRRKYIRNAAALEKLLEQEGGFSATNSSVYKALFSPDKNESALYMQQLLLAGDPAQLAHNYNTIQCNQAYTGVLCGRCRSDYGGSGTRGNKCYKCRAWAVALAVWILSRVFDLLVASLSVWYRRMQVKIKAEETRQGPPVETIPDDHETPAVEAGYREPADGPKGLAAASKQPPSYTKDTASNSPGKADQQNSKGGGKVTGGELCPVPSNEKELKKYGWSISLYKSTSQDRRRGALVNKEVVTQLDKPTVLLRSLLSFKTAHSVDAAPILEVFFVMTQMLGLLSRIQGVWDNLVMSFLSFVDFSSSSQTWTSFDCLYQLPDDDPNDSKAYYRTLITFVQPLITIVLILLCVAIIWAVKTAYYRRQARKAEASGDGVSARGPSTSEIPGSGFSAITDPSEADLASLADDSIVSSGTAMTSASETPYGISSSMALSKQAGVKLPGLVPYVRKFIVLTICTVVVYFYSTVTVQLVALFSCQRVDDTGPEVPSLAYMDYLRAIGLHWSQDYDVKCFAGSHLVWALALGIPGLLVFSVGMPLSGFIFLYRNRQKLFQPLFKAQYGQLYDHFRPRYYWWGMLRFATLLLLTITVEGLKFWGPMVQMIVFLAIVTAYTFATLCYYPWMTLLLNGLALLTLGSVLVTSYLCLTFLSEGGSLNLRETAWPKIARVVIIIINSAVGALLLMHLAAATKDIVLEYLKLAAKAVAAKTERIRVAGSNTAQKQRAKRRGAKNATGDDSSPPSSAAAPSGAAAAQD